jgi:hypothetical protein
LEGALDGLTEGAVTEDGALVGIADGCTVDIEWVEGALEGLVEGIDEGILVGWLVGAPVPANTEGCLEGAAVGWPVGDDVGSAVASVQDDHRHNNSSRGSNKRRHITYCTLILGTASSATREKIRPFDEMNRY